MTDEKESLTKNVGVHFICDNKRIITNSMEGKPALLFTFLLLTVPSILFYVFR